MPLLDTSANGVYIIAATPFTDEGAVDTASLDRLMDFYLRAGITGITVLGIMGEAPKLDHSEALDVASRVIKRIVQDNPSCKMVKHEEWPGLEKLTALKALMTNGMRKVAILCGNGGIFLPHELERGADGANTGYAYPEMLVQLVKLIKAGERAEAHDLFDRHLPLLRYEQQPGMLGLAVRKYILKRRGAIASDAQRKPGIKLSREAIAEIEFLIARLERNN